jgi:anaphase-promoting complex subunit 2
VDNGLGFVGGDAVDDVPNLRNAILQVLRGLQSVGLGGEQAQKAFAHAMDKLMGSFIVSHYMKVDWYSRKSIINHLRQWVKDGFSPLVRQVIECLADESNLVHTSDVQQWQDMAIGRLGRARVENLFDFIINWDKSMGAILDIKVQFPNHVMPLHPQATSYQIFSLLKTICVGISQDAWCEGKPV